MITSDNVDQLMAAIAKVQADGIAIGKDTTGARSIKYASLCQILEVIQERCAKHGLVLTQDEVITTEGSAALATTLYHIPSKQWKTGMSLLTISTTNPSLDQAWGSSTTYHRRYSAMMCLGLCQDGDANDNDGSHSENAPQAYAQKTYSTDKPITIGQVGLLTSLIIRTKRPNPTDYIFKTYGISAIEQLPMRKCNEVKDWLENKSIIDTDELPF